MEIFTDVEKCILERTDKRFKWIARDKNGCLYVYDTKPYKDEGYGVFSAKFGNVLFNECVSDVLFKNVTWENSPIQYRNNELLTFKEKEYLKFVFKPFASNTLYIQKVQSSDSMEHIRAVTCPSAIIFPDFEKETMYKGMVSGVKYTLKELGIEYE